MVKMVKQKKGKLVRKERGKLKPKKGSCGK